VTGIGDLYLLDEPLVFALVEVYLLLGIGDVLFEKGVALLDAEEILGE